MKFETQRLSMRNKMNRLMGTALIAVCCCVMATGCQTMKGGISKMAFWKKDTPPTSELAQRNHEIAPPSRSASVLDGTTNNRSTTSGSLAGSGDQFAQSNPETSQGSASAYQRTKPYTYEPKPMGSQAPGTGTNNGFAANTQSSTPKSDFGSSDFGNQSIARQGFGTDRALNSDPKPVSNPYTAKGAAGIPKYGEFAKGDTPKPTPRTQGSVSGSVPGSASGTIPSSRDQFGTSDTFASNKSASREYPSTKFGSYSPAASRAGLETDPGQAGYDNISQVSSTESFDNAQSFQTTAPRATNTTSNTLAKSNNRPLPSIPAAVLNRNGSYAPGSVGSSAGRFPGSFSQPSSFATQSRSCDDGCGCSSCKSASTANADVNGGGSFKLR